MLMLWSSRPDRLFHEIFLHPPSEGSTGRDSESSEEHEREVRDEIEHKLSDLHHLALVHREERQLRQAKQTKRSLVRSQTMLSAGSGAELDASISASLLDPAVAESTRPKRELNFKCSECGYATGLQITLDFHMITSHGYQIPKAARQQPRGDLRRALSIRSESGVR